MPGESAGRSGAPNFQIGYAFPAEHRVLSRLEVKKNPPTGVQLQCFAIKTAVPFFGRMPKSTVLAGSVSNCHRTVTVRHIEACRQLDWVSFFSLSTPMSQLSLCTYLSFRFAAFNFCELYVLTRILIFVLAMHLRSPPIRSNWCFILSGSVTEPIGQSSTSHLAGQQWSVRCLVQHSALLAKSIKGECDYSSYHRFLRHFRSN